jgi:hypothetical protein
MFHPLFSEVGSNNLPLEKSIYSAFLKYIREVAGMPATFLYSMLSIQDVLLGIKNSYCVHDSKAQPLFEL